MAQTQIYYRLRVRNEDDSANLIILSSKPGDANTLLCEAPEGDGQNIDPIMGTLEVGSYTWQAVDRFDGADTYTITAILSDADARNQLLSHKCVGEYSNDGTTWSPLHTGFLNDLKLSDAKTYTFIVGDTDRRERDATLFKTITTAFDKVSNIIGGPVEASTPVAYQGTPTRAWGPLLDYGPVRMVVISNPSGLVDPTNRVTLSLVGGNLPPRYLGFQGVWNGKIPNPAEYIDQQTYQYFEADAEGIYATDGSQQSQPWGSFPQLEVKLKAVSGGAVTLTFPIAQATKKASETIPGWSGPDFPIGDEQALVANSNDWLIVAWDTATMGAQPSNGTAYDVWVRPKVISEDNPLHLRGHPVDLHRLANTELGIADDATSAAATKTALGDLFYELRITEEKDYSEFTEMLKSSAGYAVRYTGAGVQEFFATRATQPDAVDTITPAKIIGDDRGEPKEVIFRVSEASAIKGVDYKLQRFRLWNANTDNASDRPVDGIIADNLVINGARRDESVKGSRIVTYDVPGMIMLSGGALVLNQPLALRNWIIAGGEVIIDRAGWGWAEGEVEVLTTLAGQVGEYVDVEAPHQVNAKVGQSPITQRGGTRKVQIVSRTEMPGTAKLKLKDAGNLAQDPPEAPDNGGTPIESTLPVPELTLAPSDDNPFTVATVTETNVAELQDVGADTELQYLVQEATPDPTDNGDAFGPLLSAAGEDTIDAPAILSGETIWVRGRAFISSLGTVGEWSDWISITLGPDDDGTGGTLSPFLLALSIDGDGVLSAEATSVVAEIITVYFVAGAAGGAAPSYAATLAGSTDIAGPPFTAAALATMDEGEVRTVGAIGEDALGNRTVLVLASITRAVNTGSGAGMAGDALITYYSGPQVEIVPGEDVTVHDELTVGQFYRNTGATRSARLQVGVGPDGPAGGKLALQYSRNSGATWRFCDAVQTGPFVLLDVENDPVPGDYFACDDDDFAGNNRKLRVVSYDGDDATPVEVGNVYIELTRSATPPATEEPDPEIPEDGLVFYWPILPGSGQVVPNAEPALSISGAADLILGDTTGAEARDPTWATGPRRLLCTGFGAGDSKYAHYDTMPSVAAGAAIFLYCDLTTLGTAVKYLCGIADGGTNDHGIGISNITRLPHAVVTEDNGGVGVTRTATGVTTIADGDKHLFGLVHDGVTLGIYVDPADGLPEGTVACGTAKEPGGRYFALGALLKPLSGFGGPDVAGFGDSWVYAGATPSVAEIAELYAIAKAIYPALP